MVYRQEEKEKMALLLEMFQSFVRGQSYFDIVYSEKLGYLRIVPGSDTADDQVFRISDFDELLRCLINDMIFERMYPDFSSNPSPVDFGEMRRLCESKLCFTPTEDRHCLEIIDTCIEKWKQDEPFDNGWMSKKAYH